MVLCCNWHGIWYGIEYGTFFGMAWYGISGHEAV